MALLSRDVLVVNAGSTSVKLSIVEPSGTKHRVSSFDEAVGVAAVGHRVVHGGERFLEPTELDEAVVAVLRELTEIAPLHNRPALAAIDSARATMEDVPHVAVFDTAFHATIPAVARTYALPKRYRELGIRRFGFHGISVQSVVERVAVQRLVVCHLGGGSSVTAVLDGRSVDTTMGFTPLEGVPMGSRSGSVDPGALLHLLRLGVGIEELAEALQRESGLVGLAGTADVRELEHSDAPEARFALEHYCYRVSQAIAAMAVTLDGVDSIVFTGGIGEGSSLVRDLVCSRLAHLGVGPEGSARVEVLPTGEEELIAGATRSLLGLR